MMTKKKGQKIRAARIAWALPAVAALLLAFAEPVHKVIPAETPADPYSNTLNEQGFTKISGLVLTPEGKPPIRITMKEGVFNIDPDKHFTAPPPSPPPPPLKTGTSSGAPPPTSGVYRNIREEGYSPIQ